MKKVLFLVPLFIFILLAIFLYSNIGKDSQYLASELVGKKIPEFSSQTLQGATFTQQNIIGPALINVWASWCPACAAENEMLLKLKNQGLRVYGLNYKDDKADAEKFLQALGNPFTEIFQDKEGHIGFDLGVYGAPETFFVDSQERIQYRHVGEIHPGQWERELKPIYEALK